jgi:iron complex outermembrane receptor protein
MTSNLFRTRLLATSMIAGVALASSPVFAQATSGVPASLPDTTAPADDAGSTIIVTGSRLPQPNLTSAAPVTVLSQQEIKLSGTTRVEDLLNSLPQVFAGQASSISNGATGTATVDLRGLGANRTLVLVNGRRLLPGDPIDSSADLNAIPSALVKRVEVLTGGASSTYGADAVAGVVNFIMDTDFTGFRLDGQYSLYQHGNHTDTLRAANDAQTAAGASGYGYPTGNEVDGGTVDVSATMGVGFDDNRGHIVAYVGYRKVKPVFQSDRDYSSCGATTSKDVTNSAVSCGGSGTSAAGSLYDSASHSYHVGPGQTFLPGTSLYNFAPTNYFQRPDERYSAGFFAHYDVSEAIKPYMEFMFMDDRTLAQIAPSGDFGNTLTTNCDNPLLSTQQKQIICSTANLVNGFVGSFPLTANTNPNAAAPINFIDPTTGATYNKGFLQLLRRNVEGGPRIADLQHTEYRAVLGSKGDLGSGFSYDAYYQYGRTVYAQTYLGEFSTAKLTNALDVVTDPATGLPACRSALTGVSPLCVPYNAFTLNAVTPGAVNYVSSTGFQRGVVSEQVLSGSVTALLGEHGFKSPWASDGLSINFGGEYRKESLELNTDEAFSTGDLTGQGGPTLPISGNFKVVEGFVEARMPIIQDSFIKELSLNGGYRYSHYTLSNGGGYNTNTYKIGLEFAPIRDIRFRGSYNRAVRTPNLQELFAVQHVQLDGSTDPCAGSFDTDKNGNVLTTVQGNTLAQCQATGLTAAQFGNIAANPAGQYNGLVGGTPTLRPEKSTTKTFGIVLQPSFIPRLAITLDYFDIKVANAIQMFGADTILATCVQSGDPTICGLIHRNAAGSLWLTNDGYVSDLSTNIGSVKTRGVDFNASYSHEIGSLGSLGFSVVGTYLRNLTTDNGISQPYNCAGYFGAQCGIPNPKWRGKARVSYTSPMGIGLSAQWRYFGKVDVDSSSNNPTLATPYSFFAPRIGSQSYFDLAATARVADKFTFRLGVNNIFDKAPPIISTAGLNNCPGTYCSGNTFPAVYDALGRYVYAGFTIDL